ncbi:uncharacterized protein BXZ73DRAFT_91234 [Epithele typhae]|uniref:uncharacterized protein n=1 Tax=Epithele typhae TaxID=378194 RepID=UPI002008C29C|nr:uncharacterized protein BXZ73DRAFT_91234 [Epithele typhae]KAH9924650.1 hypothetical protein BXZ73DRAFT_91234 [Epithele typhae]
MSSLAPPSPSVSPAPSGGRSPSYRASMGPTSARGGPQGLPPASPRPNGARPTSELLGGAGMFQTPEAEAIDQWFETFQNYEATLEEMAAASLDVNFKEELSAIEQWFKVLSEAERTAALYSLLQHSTQVQIRFFITVLQQMARSDPMTALLSPAVGGSMQSQMEAKLASMSLKSPGLKSNLPASPTARNFSGSGMGASFLSPESANNTSGADPAATLAHQRAKLKASNAAHRISAPVLSTTIGADRNTWGTGSNQLGQVDERAPSPGGQEITIPSSNPASRPKSTDFSGLANALKSPRVGDDIGDQLSPMPGGSWASMDTRNPSQSLDAAAQKLNDWNGGNSGAVPLMSDPPKRLNRLSKGAPGNDVEEHQHQNGGGQRNVSGGFRNNGNLSAFGGQAGWGGARSPALSNTSGRYSDDGSMNGLGMNGFAMGMGNPALAGLQGGGGFNMAALAAAGMAPVSPFNSMFNMSNLAAMGLSPEQMIAMQMAAAGQLGQLGQAGFNPMGMLGGQNNMRGNRGVGNRDRNTKSPGQREKKDDEDVDPKLLEDIPAWLRSLRLHKYTPNFENVDWRDMVMMDEAQLEAKGVAALGARRKMLKTFEVVRKKMGLDDSAGSA